MVNAVFAVAISNEFQATPSSVIPAWSAVFVAVVIGVLIYRMGVPITWPTVVGTVILYAVIYVGEVVPVTLPAEVVGLAPGAPVDHHPVFLCRRRVDAPGLAAAATARLHQRHPALHRSGNPLRRGAHRESDHRGPGDQLERPGGNAAPDAAAVRDGRLRRHFRIPRSRGLGHHVQAAQQGDRCPLRRLPRLGRRRCAGAHRHHRRHGRVRDVRRLGSGVRDLQHAGHQCVRARRGADRHRRSGSPIRIRPDAARRDGRAVRRHDDGRRRSVCSATSFRNGAPSTTFRRCRTATSRPAWRWAPAWCWPSAPGAPVAPAA